MNIKKTIKNLEHIMGKFPQSDLEYVISNSEQSIPEFIRILKNADKKVNEIIEDSNYFGHIYALYFLAQFRVTESYPLIINLISKPGKIADEFLGDVITEDLHRIIASVATDDISLIKKVIENDSLDEFVRCAAIRSLLVLYNSNRLKRDEIIVYFKNLFQKLERKPLYVWDELIICCCDLHVSELYGQIKEVYTDGLADFFPDDIEYVNKCFKKDKDVILNKLKNDPRCMPVSDIISDLKDWACFREKIYSNPKENKNLIDSGKVIDIIPDKSNRKKIGRNDPCPCNSGIKYKKCCGKNL